MSIAAAEDTRIDSRLATLLLASVFSFALGIFISLMATQHPDDRLQTMQPCPSRCQRLILMSLEPPQAGGDECGSITLPKAFATQRA